MFELADCGFGVVGAEVLGREEGGDEGVVGRERLIQAPRRWMGVVGVWVEGVVGVIGFMVSGPRVGRVGGERVSFAGRNLLGVDVVPKNAGE